MLLLRLCRGICSGCHNATPTPIFFGNVIIVGRVIMLLFRFIQVISSGCHRGTPTPIFWNCHYCGKGTLRFCFDLARVFLQGTATPLLHPTFFRFLIIVKGVIILLLRLSHGISSGCHHAIPTTYNCLFSICHCV